MVDDAARRDLFEALEHQLGPGPATTLMELLPPVGWADVARQSDLVALRGEIAQQGAALRTEMADLRVELKTEMAALRSELDARFDRQYAKLVLTFVPMVFGTAGLVLAAAKLA
ncbi:MAG: hypothetical protein ACRD12_18885 [Acidimicrobiales bacterium]